MGWRVQKYDAWCPKCWGKITTTDWKPVVCPHYPIRDGVVRPVPLWKREKNG